MIVNIVKCIDFIFILFHPLIIYTLKGVFSVLQNNNGTRKILNFLIMQILISKYRIMSICVPKKKLYKIFAG